MPPEVCAVDRLDEVGPLGLVVVEVKLRVLVQLPAPEGEDDPVLVGLELEPADPDPVGSVVVLEEVPLPPVVVPLHGIDLAGSEHGYFLAEPKE